MELIPILSTIILVATISTFMLAVGAYILYKVRERKGIQVVSQQPSEINAELVTPVSPQPLPSERIKPQPIFIGSQSAYQRPQPSSQPFQQRYSSGPIPYNGYGNQPRNVSEQDNSQQRAYAGNLRNIQPQGEVKPKSAKFMKYTSEGYVPTKEDKDSGALRWK
ncbi:MAG TPA: hypothetical protein VMV32_05770 [Ignavibacteriaceae bacterium]|nr:hypothetical protein [Ignavibacteriaceae bacterium]